MSVIFGVAVLVTGAIWAKAQWGVWWEWREPTLVSFLIVFLLYATYYPLRYAIEDRDRQARYASVFAITAGAFVPLNFMAVRLAEPFIHPRTFASAGGLPGEMLLAFLVCLVGDGAALGDPGRFELARRRPSAPAPDLERGLRPRRSLPRGLRLMPALPLDEAGKYVAARLHRLRRAAPDLRRDHGREAAAGSSASSRKLADGRATRKRRRASPSRPSQRSARSGSGST